MFADLGAELNAEGNPSDELLLSALCGNVAENMGYIEERFKAKTGITMTLNGDEFLQELKDGNTRGIVQQSEKKLGYTEYFYQWRILNHENPDVMIYVQNVGGGKLIPTWMAIDQHDAMVNTESQYRVEITNQKEVFDMGVKNRRSNP